MSSINYSIRDAISPARHVSHIVSHQTLPQHGISPLVIPGGTYRASVIFEEGPQDGAGMMGSSSSSTYLGAERSRSRSRSPPRYPSVPTTHPVPRGGAEPSTKDVGVKSPGSRSGGYASGFTDLRFSPAQRKKGTYGDGYCTIGRGLMRDLFDAADVQATGYVTGRQLPSLLYSRHVRQTAVPRYNTTRDDHQHHTRVFIDSPATGGFIGGGGGASPSSSPQRRVMMRKTMNRANSSMSLASTGSKVFDELSPRGGHERRLSPSPVMSHERAPLLSYKKLMKAKRPKLYT